MCTYQAGGYLICNILFIYHNLMTTNNTEMTFKDGP